MDAIKVQCLEWGKYKSDTFLASKVLGLFEKVERTLDAHGMRFPMGMFSYQLCNNF
jgi:hypothetical protein